MTLTNKPIYEPDLKELMRGMKREIIKSLHCVMIGKIQIFDATKKTAQIQLLFKRVLPDSAIMEYPVLVDCPVFTLQGGGGSIKFPIAAGDNCIVLFCDRNIDAWFNTGSAQAPYTSRIHDLSDGMALVGVNSLVSSMAAYPTTQVVLSYGGAEIDLTVAGLVKISNQTTTLLTLMNLLITTIEALQVQGPLGLTPASITALEAIKIQMALLLL